MYTFTGDQLTRLLEQTIDLFCENLDHHMHVKDAAQAATVGETLQGLDAERELWEQGEVKQPGQLLGTKAICDQAADAIEALPVDQWPGWIAYILEDLDARLYGKHLDTERGKTLERVANALHMRLSLGRW